MSVILKRQLKEYHNNFLEIYQKVGVKEEDYYLIFCELLKSYFQEVDGYHILINTTDIWSHNVDINYLDKPDFLISKRKIPILRIEAKIPDDNIDYKLRHSGKDRLFNQIYRYRGRNEGKQPVMITDFKKLWIIDKDSENIFDKDHIIYKIITIINDDLTLNINVNDQISVIINYLISDIVISIDNLQNLIEPLAEYAKNLHDEILEIITLENSQSEEEKTRINLLNLSSDLKNTIFKDSKIDNKDQFADFFAQTIIYSSFIGWLRFCKEGNKSEDFKILILKEFLPKGTFIQKIFINLKSILSERIYNHYLLSLEGLLSGTKFKLIIKNIDILMSTFYSDFLNLYDAEKAKKLGVVFTPTEIVDYMIDGIDKILTKYFEKSEGILSPNIKFLDPASGTMSFACSIIRKAFEKFEIQTTNLLELPINFENWVKHQFIENTYAFEILMAPYVLGHLKTMITIEDLGVDIDLSKYKLKSYLMNTLMERPQESLDFFIKNQEVKEEILKALYVRHLRDIMIVLGNPPYNISSQNVSRWIQKKTDDYKNNLTERNLKILSDDYVKFIRFAQWRIAKKSKSGIIALITNNKYFYGDIFRTMRYTLKKDFDMIYTINLHGDLRKGETGNLFDIRVGVGIIFLIRLNNHTDNKCKIFSWDIPDPSKNLKFSKLNNGFDFNIFQEVRNQKYFIEIDTDSIIEEEFDSFKDIKDFFISNPKSGIMSGRDALVYNITKKNLEDNYNFFFNKKFNDLKRKNIIIKDTKNWKIADAINGYSHEEPLIIKVNYRGFDVRYLLYDSRLVEGHRMGYIDQISNENPAISSTKNVRKGPYTNCLITKYPVEKCFLSVRDTSYVFPLKINSKYNIKIPRNIVYKASREQMFYYIYAIISSNFYRSRYASQLLRNFPRIPIPKEEQNFIDISKNGFHLAQVHLFNEKCLDTSLFSRSATDNYLIQTDLYYDENKRKIFFGKDPKAFWIGNITSDMWNFEIGGRKQIYEWLKARRFSKEYKKNTINRRLLEVDVEYLMQICAAIKSTIQIVKRIDPLVKKILNSNQYVK